MRRQAGFTLVEAIATALLIILFSSALVLTSFPLVQYYKEMVTRLELEEIRVGLMRYAQDFAGFPPTLRDLVWRRGGNANTLWRGPYVSRAQRDLLYDAWNQPYTYRVRNFHTGPRGVAVVLSRGKNRELDSTVSGFHLGTWEPQGDDLAIRPTSQLIHWELMEETLHRLTIVRGEILEDNPNQAPATYNMNRFRDPWGRVMRYRRCNRFAAVVYSLGPNRVSDVGNGAILCTRAAPPRSDEVYLVIVWERTP